MDDGFTLPPLNALRAFGAVGRHLSFRRAAEELHVTAPAVTQQIKNLESILGVPLFHRHGRSITLTEAGHQLLPGIESGFGILEDAVRPFSASNAADYISCSTVGAFAARWLVPRLQRWTGRYPEIDIRISATGELVSFERQSIDLAIRLSDGDEPGLYSVLLQREEVVPLCSSVLLDQEPPLRSPEDLRHHQLIHFTPATGRLNTRWTDWLDLAGVADVDLTRGIFLNDGSAAMYAAVAGQGVVLAPRVLASAELAAGTLIIPFQIPLPTELSWYLVMPEANLRRPEIIAFRDWLLEEFDSQT